MSLANETDFGERVSVIRTTILTSLNELQDIIDKSLPHAYAYSHVESERLRQQTRANVEAVRAVEAEEQVKELVGLLRRMQYELRSRVGETPSPVWQQLASDIDAALAKVGP